MSPPSVEDVPDETISTWLHDLTKAVKTPPKGCAESGSQRTSILYGLLVLYLSGACANCASESCNHQATAFDHVKARVNERVQKNVGNAPVGL